MTLRLLEIPILLTHPRLSFFQPCSTFLPSVSVFLSFPLNQSIAGSVGDTPVGASPHLHYGTTLGGHALHVSMQGPFPYQVTHSKRHGLASAKSSLSSAMPGYPFRKQPNKQDWLLGSVTYAHMYRPSRR